MPRLVLHIVHLLVLLCLSNISSGQINLTNKFRSANGLDTDIIKCITQDSIGFVWIGTDDGLYRYNGTSFQRYPEAAPSKFFKDFFKTSDGRLLGIHDLGIIVIEPGIHQVSFTELLPGNRTLSDSALWFPKSVFEDSKGFLWIAEPQSVVRYKDGKWKRFDFSSGHNSSSFVRSFNFIQDSEEELIIISNTGIFSSYQYANEQINDIFESSNIIYTVEKIGNIFYAGTESGLHKLELSPEIQINEVPVKGLNSTSAIRDILPLANRQFLICSEQENTSIISINKGKLQASSLLDNNSYVNKAYQCEDGTIWISTNKGIKVYNQSTFEKITLNDLNTYIECMIPVPGTEKMYIANKGSFYSLNTRTKESKKLFTNTQEYFLSGASSQGNTLVSSAFDLMLIQDDQIKLKADYSEFGRYIFHVFADKGGSFWVSQEASPGLKKVDPHTLKFTHYGTSAGIPYEVSAITERGDDIIATSSHPDHYLFVKSKPDDIFKDISVPFKSAYRTGLTIETVVATDTAIWLGTNFGLFVYSNNQLSKFLIAPAIDNNAVRMLQLDNQSLWIGSTAGLIRYNLSTHEYALFTENSGLPVNTVNNECFVISDSNIWVGTSQGIAVSKYLKNEPFQPTKRPEIIHISVNGKDYNPEINSQVNYHSTVKLVYSALSYPTSDLQFIYKLNDKDDWSAPTSETEIVFNQIEDGDYIFQVKAKRLGNYGWSQPTTFTFSVKPPFYKTPFFLFLILLVFGLAIFGTLTLTRRFEKRRQAQLRLMVSHRTQELNDIKNNLEVAVKDRTAELEQTLEKLKETQNHLVQAEKMASLGVLTAGIAHEINNPVNYLKGGLYSLDKLILETEKLKSDTELYGQFQEVMGFMKMGMDRITHIVNGLGRYSRKSTEQNLPCNLHDILINCLLILEHELKGKIEVEKKLEATKFTIMGDEGNLHQLLVNIISNAIHATTEFGKLTLKSCNPNPDKLLLEIKDSGSGMSEEVLTKLFDPFFTTKAPGIGTGLGLFIAKRIVNEHGGTIHFQSKPDIGTSVFITFSIA